MPINNTLKLQRSLGLLFLALITTATLANQDKHDQAESDENEVVVDVGFQVVEQFSGLSETSSSQKQMVVEFDAWQTLAVDRYQVKFKVTENIADGSEQLFMIETQILNRRENILHHPSVMTEVDKIAGIEIAAETKVNPAFKLSFRVLSK